MKITLDKRKGKDLFLENASMIQDNNVKMMNVVLSVCTGVFAALCIMSFFVSDYMQFQTFYAGTCIVSLMITCIHHYITKENTLFL